MMTGPATNRVDFDLHGIVGIRVQGGSASDVAAVRRQLGPLESPLTREPDLVIRFVEHLPLDKSLRLLGAYEAGVTDDAFWVLRGKHKSQTKVRIPVHQIGQDCCELVCETGLPAVPLLIAIINLTALKNGAVPLHAAAFDYQGTGLLSTGWSKGGKTETLLSFMAHGARYIADEWVYLLSDGRMCGIPEPIRVWDWHLESMPQYRSRLSGRDRLRLQSIKLLQAGLQAVPAGRWLPGRLKDRLAPLVKQQAHVDLTPARLFGKRQLQLSGRLDKVLFVISHAAANIQVDPLQPRQIAERMVHSLQYEQFPFMGFYRMFRFAFPDLTSDLVERTEQLQLELLTRALAEKEAYCVAHPYPVSLPQLFAAMEPLCRRHGTAARRAEHVSPANKPLVLQGGLP